MKYLIYQMDVIPGDPEANRNKVKNWVEEVVKIEKPDTVVLPEMWTTAYTLPELHELADVEGEPTKSFLERIANDYNINIIAGSIANKVEGKVYNSAFVVNRSGETIYQYDKIHLVPMLDEHSYLNGGEESVKVFELDGIKMGVIICYDLRFPELARSLALQGAEVLHVVAEWPTPRKNHWEKLQIARAIENQMYVISSNRVGRYIGVGFCGTSMTVDPGGEVLLKGSENEENHYSVKVDLDSVNKFREEVPVFRSRVPNLYK
ncbi:carbon-nitrogen family hydrolase [Virgibacillus ihumii]|uniref:carbon-nitrogen family hydrolase n=1 Tax=Virgibacillus ihumii TaxID=2686091 RepID=UPI00157DC097|nr:carbon-nitrogen family hydrolase [Virgibacillus ihumii]